MTSLKMIELELFNKMKLCNKSKVKFSPYNICAFCQTHCVASTDVYTVCSVYYNSKAPVAFEMTAFDILKKYENIFELRNINGKEFYINKNRVLAEYVYEDGRILLEFPYDVYVG